MGAARTAAASSAASSRSRPPAARCSAPVLPRSYLVAHLPKRCSPGAGVCRSCSARSCSWSAPICARTSMRRRPIKPAARPRQASRQAADLRSARAPSASRSSGPSPITRCSLWMPTFTQKFGGLSPSQALWSNTIGLIAMVIAVPFWGALSDRVGRKPLLMASAILIGVLCYPLLSLMAGGKGSGAGAADPDPVRHSARALFRRRPGGDRRDLPDASALDLDVERICAFGCDLRRLRAVRRDLADRGHGFAGRRRPIFISCLRR